MDDGAEDGEAQLFECQWGLKDSKRQRSRLSKLRFIVPGFSAHRMTNVVGRLELRLLGVLCLLWLGSISSMSNTVLSGMRVVRVSQQVWRTAAVEHRHRIRQLLEPGMIPRDDNEEQKSSRHRHTRPNSANGTADRNSRNSCEDTDRDSDDEDFFTALDPKHPVYNFLVEYYGIKGPKGPRRLARWSPSPGLLVQQETNQIQTLEELEMAAAACTRPRSELDGLQFTGSHGQAVEHGVLLEGALPDDFADLLPLRAATVLDDGQGVLYSPSLFFGRNNPTRHEENARLATPFVWYQSILRQTLSAEPILHCHGLHGGFLVVVFFFLGCLFLFCFVFIEIAFYKKKLCAVCVCVRD
jgi:hypothetical protein